MNHLNAKSLTFYGVAISSVLLLFKVVTTYGEKNLKAPPVVGGSYRLTLATNSPNCDKSNSLLLNMQQSGIYLNASLSPINANADSPQKPSLTGILKNQNVSFSGKINPEILCHPSNPQIRASKSVVMEMQLTNQDKMTGKLMVHDVPQTLEFIASKQSTTEKSQKSNSH